MSNKALIEEILEGITKGLHKEGRDHLNNAPKRDSYGSKKNILVIFTGSTFELESILHELKKLKKYGYSLSLVMSRAAEKIIGVDQIKNLLYVDNLYTEENWEQCIQILEGTEGLLVPNLTQNTAAKLRVGIQDTLCTFCIWKGLWLNKPVFASTRGILPSGGNLALEKIMKEHLQALEKMGVELFDHLDYWSLLEGLDKKNRFTDLEQKDGEAIRKETRQILTQKDILSMIENQHQLYIRKGSVFTPLAQDWIKEKKIQVIEE